MKQKAQFIICQAKNGLFAARSRNKCSKMYLPGGVLGMRDTLESLCRAQGWIVEKGELVHAEEMENHYCEWYTATVKKIDNGYSHWVSRETIERYDEIGDIALSYYDDWLEAKNESADSTE